MKIKMSKSQIEAAKFYFKQPSFRFFYDGFTPRPASEVWASAIRHVFFRERLTASVKQDRKRSASARKGWKTRRLNAA